MTTGYTAFRLEELRQISIQRAPGLPTLEKLRKAPAIEQLATAGTELGMLLRLSLKGRRKPETLFFNCVVARELMIGINKAAMEAKWWNQLELSGTEPLPDLVREDLETATPVIALSTLSEPRGLFVNATDGKETWLFYIPRRFAADLFSAINDIGERATWWDRNFRLLPIPH